MNAIITRTNKRSISLLGQSPLAAFCTSTDRNGFAPEAWIEHCLNGSVKAIQITVENGVILHNSISFNKTSSKPIDKVKKVKYIICVTSSNFTYIIV